MLAKRRLVLSSTAVLGETILRREDIADSQRAAEVLDDARRQARQILDDAEHQAQQLQDQALAQFWDRTERFLQDLEQQRQIQQEQGMHAVEQLLHGALSGLLDKADLAERTRALVRHLAASQPVETVATLSAHPDMLLSLSQWLEGSRYAEHWQLKGDASLAADSLRLSDANGAFDVDWASLRRGLLGQ
jgi:type III secretion protein L